MIISRDYSITRESVHIEMGSAPGDVTKVARYVVVSRYDVNSRKCHPDVFGVIMRSVLPSPRRAADDATKIEEGVITSGGNVLPCDCYASTRIVWGCSAPKIS